MPGLVSKGGGERPRRNAEVRKAQKQERSNWDEVSEEDARNVKEMELSTIKEDIANIEDDIKEQQDQMKEIAPAMRKGLQEYINTATEKLKELQERAREIEKTLDADPDSNKRSEQLEKESKEAAERDFVSAQDKKIALQTEGVVPEAVYDKLNKTEYSYDEYMDAKTRMERFEEQKESLQNDIQLFKGSNFLKRMWRSAFGNAELANAQRDLARLESQYAVDERVVGAIEGHLESTLAAPVEADELKEPKARMGSDAKARSEKRRARAERSGRGGFGK